MIRWSSHFFLFLFSVLLSSGTGQSQTRYDLAGLPGSALRMGFGARGIGMANALSAIRSGDAVSYYNPALVPFQATPVGLLAAGFLPFDRRLNFISYTQNLKPSGGISIGIMNAGLSNIEGRNRDGIVTETYSTSENVFLFSFGTRLNDRTAVGVSTKILYHSLFESVKSTTVGFDVGISYSFTDEWHVAFVLQDINSKYKWDTSGLYGREGSTTIERFPLRRKIGISYASGLFPAAISSEVEWIGTTVLTRLGTEILIVEGLTARGGVDQISFAGEINAKPSFGFSLQTPIATWKPALHYCYVIEPYTAGGFHILSLTLNFE